MTHASILHFALITAIIMVSVAFAKQRGCCASCPDNGPDGWAQLSSSFDQVLCHKGFPADQSESIKCPTLWESVIPTPFCVATASQTAAINLLPLMLREDESCPYVAPFHLRNSPPRKTCVTLIPSNPFFDLIQCPDGYEGMCAYSGPGVSDSVPTNTLQDFITGNAFEGVYKTLVPCDTIGCSVECQEVEDWNVTQVCMPNNAGFLIGYLPYVGMLPQFSGCGTGTAFPSAQSAIYNGTAGCYFVTTGVNVTNGGCDPENNTLQCLYSRLKVDSL